MLPRTLTTVSFPHYQVDAEAAQLLLEAEGKDTVKVLYGRPS